jgi:hypothetical protein
MTNPYGIAHQRTRAALLARLRQAWREHEAGLRPAPICPRCGDPLDPAHPIQLGHSTAERKQLGLPGDRLEHAFCNMSAGARSKAKAQHPSNYQPSQDW